MKRSKEKKSSAEISLVIALWADIFIAIAHWTQCPHFSVSSIQGILQILQVTVFFITALIIRWFGQIIAFPRWTWLLLLLRYFFIDLEVFSFFFLVSLKLFSLIISYNNLRVSRLLRHLRFLGKLFSGVSSVFLRFNGQ